MKKKNLRLYTISACLVLGLSLAGCGKNETEANQSTPAATEAAASTESLSEDITEAAIDFSEGAPDETVISAFENPAFKDFTVVGHNVEEISDSEYGDQYIAHDTVSISYSAGNPTGLFAQTVTKDANFYLNKDTNGWDMLKDETTSCNVNNSVLAGSSWKCDTLDPETLSELFTEEIPADDTGALYIRFNKRAGLFAFNMSNEKNTSIERFFTASGIGGKLTWVGDAGKLEASFKIPDGSVTDDGDMIMAFSTDAGTLYMNFVTDLTSITEMDYDVALGAEIEEGKVYIESLTKFDVSTTSIENGEWKQTTGGTLDNKSPDLSWDAVDGATKYAVIMLDKDASNWLHWYVMVDKTQLTEGEFADRESGYFGPYPPETHEYDVYVVALAGEPEKSYFQLDATGGDINSKLTKLNIAADGSTGNVLAYGMIGANFTPAEQTYR